MRNFKSIARRELLGYFQSPIAYVFIITFLLATMGCTFYLADFYRNGDGTASLESFFVWHPWLYLFFIPAIGMRLWSEERHINIFMKARILRRGGNSEPRGSL